MAIWGQKCYSLNSTILTMKKNEKIIGTFIPLRALRSLKFPDNKNGTFAEGLLFLDWLKETGQGAWQLLPLYETHLEIGSAIKHVPSPYKGYGVGLDPVYLPQQYANIFPTEKERDDFIKENQEWILDYALFCAIRDYFKTDDWTMWEDKLKNRDEKTLKTWANKLEKSIDHNILVQWQLHKSFNEIKTKAKKLNIIIVGDLSFYVPFNSPLVWTNQEVFNLEKDGKMKYVSGVLPSNSKFNFGRQVWGHPFYNWDNKKVHKQIIQFWKNRLAYSSQLYDLLRLDHAQAFFEYGKIDPKNEKNDVYVEGPGSKIFEDLVKFAKQTGLSIFAEDIGDSLIELQKSLKKLNIPGVKVFRFGLKEKENLVDDENLNFKNYPENTIAYTTTHDTETLLGFLQKTIPEQNKQIAQITGVSYDPNPKEFLKKIRSGMIASPSNIVIIPIQDWLATTERINIPGTELPKNDKNWSFRMATPLENLPKITLDK